MSMDIEHSFYDDSQTGLILNTPYQGSYSDYNIFDYRSAQMLYEISIHGDEQYHRLGSIQTTQFMDCQ